MLTLISNNEITTNFRLQMFRKITTKWIFWSISLIDTFFRPIAGSRLIILTMKNINCAEMNPQKEKEKGK